MPNSRAKGIDGELRFRDMFRCWYSECERSYGQARKKYSQPDLIGGGIEKDWYVECKHVSKIYSSKLTGWLNKLETDWMMYSNSGCGEIPLLIYKIRNQRWKNSTVLLDMRALERFGEIGKILEPTIYQLMQLTWQEFSNAMDNWKGVGDE